jgi:long-subunit fatty acid transport protein
VHWYFGTLSDRDALVARATGVTGRVTSLERKLSGVSATFGATVQAGDRLHAGLAFETAPRLDDDYTAWLNDSVTTAAPSNDDIHLPPRVQGGIAYRPRNTVRTTFAMDVVYTPWQETEDPLRSGQTLYDTWDFRFGLEHVYYNSLPARIGFRYARSYAMREADRAAFTFGVGYRVDRFLIDAAGEVGKQYSRQDPVWPRAEQGPAVGAGLDRVEDTELRFVVGVEAGF